MIIRSQNIHCCLIEKTNNKMWNLWIIAVTCMILPSPCDGSALLIGLSSYPEIVRYDTIRNASTNITHGAHVAEVSAIAVDQSMGWMFVADTLYSKLLKVNYMDPNQMEETIGSTMYVISMDIDTGKRRLFVAAYDDDEGIHQLMSMDYAGQHKVEIAKFADTICLDPYNTHIFYIEYIANEIRRCKYDGSDMHVIHQHVHRFPGIQEYAHMDIDIANQRLYWTTDDAEYKVYAMNTDGTQVQIIAVSGDVASGLVFAGGDLYVSWGTDVIRMDTAGQEIERYGFYPFYPYAIESIEFPEHVCRYFDPCLNGGTCVVIDYVNVTCACPESFSGQNCEIELPYVTVTGCEYAMEGDSCNLWCNVVNDSFVEILNYIWQYKPNFKMTYVNMKENSSHIQINDIAYYDSGEYKCIVTTTSGTLQQSHNVAVPYAPNGMGSNEANENVMHGMLGEHILLQVKVHSYPANAYFNWTRHRAISAGPHIEENLGNNVTRSSLLIRNATEHDFDNYTVLVYNGDFSLSTVFTVMLKKDEDIKEQKAPNKESGKDNISLTTIALGSSLALVSIGFIILTVYLVYKNAMLKKRATGEQYAVPNTSGREHEPAEYTEMATSAPYEKHWQGLAGNAVSKCWRG